MLKILVIEDEPQVRSNVEEMQERAQRDRCLAGVGLAVAIAVLGVGGLGYSLLARQMPQFSERFAPTSVPYVTSEAECERRANSEWREGECWDLEHRPDF